MSELRPYVKTVFHDYMQGKSLGQNYLRRDEMIASVSTVMAKVLEFHEIADIVDLHEESESIFRDLLENGAILEEFQQFAGSYYRFQSKKFIEYSARFRSSDAILSTVNRIGPRFLKDVFQGYRAQVEPESQAEKLPGSYTKKELLQVNWGEVSKRIEGASLVQIRKKAEDLISAIEQSELDDESKSNAMARARAVTELLDAPNPPWEAIVGLLNNRYFTAILNAAAILQLILGVL